jgi:hypothetical protein
VPNDLPFQYSKRWRNISTGLSPQALAALEQHDRELEDYLNTLTTGTGSGDTMRAAKWGGGEQLFGTSFNDMYWNLLVTDTEGDRADYFDLEGGETNNRIHIYTEGTYRIMFEVDNEDTDNSGPGTVEVEVRANGGATPGVFDTGKAISHGPVGSGASRATGHLLVGMQVDDYLTLAIKGDVWDLVAWISVEYAGPYGFQDLPLPG